MKVFLLMVMMCSPDAPGLMCRTIFVENHPGRVANSREECREASREHVLSFFAREDVRAVYRGHDCVRDERGDML